MRDRILRIKEVKGIVGLSVPTIYRLAREKKFPRPIRLGLNSSGFLESSIFAWIEDRVQASKSEAI